MMDFLCFSSTDWDEIWGSRQQIMLRLANLGHRVLFVERQVGPEHLLRDTDLRARKLAALRGHNLVQVQKNLWRWQPPLLPPGRYYSVLINAFGQRWLARRVQPVINELGFQSPILWLYPPHSAPLIGRFSEKLSVYHCIERFSGEQTGRKRRVMDLQETDLLQRADLVFTHSEGLRQRYAPLTQRPIILLPSAADVHHFQSTGEVDEAVARIPTPRLGVMGTLDRRIDLPMLVELARQHPEWHLVLIGHIRSERVDLRQLLGLSNVHNLGKQPFERLPALLNGMSANLIPYRLTGMTRFISPLKAYEYLAVGKPIISTALPEIMSLEPWITIVPEQAESIEEQAQAFAAAIASAIEQDSAGARQARRQAAQEHTWDARLKTILTTIEAFPMDEKR